MKLNAKGRYAVMALADLAMMKGDGPTSLSAIASRQHISLSYLEQLFAKLRRNDLVKSVRGPGGGYLLARNARDIRIGDIVGAVCEPRGTGRCRPTEPATCRTNVERCLTHDLWEELESRIEDYLGSVSLEDVCSGRVAGGAGAPRGRVVGL